jgi:hypothetical protein
VADLQGLAHDQNITGQFTHDLRRLRLKDIIGRVPDTQRYRLQSA